MDCSVRRRRPAKWLKFLLAILASTVTQLHAHAERFSFRGYGASEGLTNLAGACLTSDRPGHILVCSEHGVFGYDGRQFVNLGPSQGLRDGGVPYDLTETAGGRIAVRYVDKLFVSDTPASEASPASLSFRPVDGGAAGAFYRENRFQVAPWRRGLAIVVGRETMQVVIPASGPSPSFQTMGYGAGEQAVLARPSAVFSVHGALWETFEDGRVCSADPGSVRCFGRTQGLTLGPWRQLVAGSGGTVLARSVEAMATIDPKSGRVTEERLPDQGGPYRNYAQNLGLFRTPSGELFTQSVAGVIVRKPAGWTEFTAQDGVPAGIIVDALTGRNGQLWLQLLGHGLYAGLGYGHWEALQKSDGLSGELAWQAVRAPGGSLWVSTDTGVDEVREVDGKPGVVRVVPGASFALAVGPQGRIWASAGEADVRVIDPATGSFSRITTPPIDAIVAAHGRVWLGTEDGLFTADVRPDAPPPEAVRDGSSSRQVVGLASDGAEGVWLLSGGRLWHRHADGSRVLVAGAWPAEGFEPLVMAAAPDGHLWVGGGGGLFELTVARDRVTSCVAVPQDDIRSNSVVAVMIDHEGWVWVGTGDGISVFDGHRWVSADTDLGLVWNDVSEGGITEDSDGSIWIVTSQGLSHLVDRSWLFRRQKLRVVIAEARLGDTLLPSPRLPYSTEPLSIDFGTFNDTSNKSVVFRYRLSGVDHGWAETASGPVRYPFVPPGRHVLTLVGTDVLSHDVSPPVSLAVTIAYPWWRRWWADALYAAMAAGLFWVAVAWRDREARRRQRRLEALVERRTREMRFAQAELKRQATLDSLTGLLNRGEVQRRLADRLEASGRELVVAMIDLDHFKRINDEHGHLAGDDILCATGVRLSANLRSDDHAGRYGGEEFVVVLDDTDGQAADRMLILHQSIRQAPFYVDDVAFVVTCSIGVAWSAPGDTWKSLIRRADAALYEAKHGGRDRIVESRDGQALPTAPGRPE